MTESIDCVVSALNTNLHTIVKNWELDRRLHNMMKIGDEYQVLDDICSEFERITESTSSDVGFSVLFKSNYTKFHDFSDDYFDDIYRNQLEQYLKEAFGLEVGESIDDIYSLLQSRDYSTLASLFRKHNFIKKINDNKDKFPFYELKEKCKEKKIIFDNFDSLKINGPFVGFDEEEKPIACQYTSEEVTKLFTEGWIGTFVDPSKSTGFSNPTLQNVAILINENDDEINNPDKICQGYGRNRGLDTTQQPFFRMIARKGVKSCFDTKSLMARNADLLIFEAREKYSEDLLKTINTEISEEIVQRISDDIDNNKKIDYKFCNDFVIKKLVDLYNRNNHNLEKTIKEFSHVLKDVKKNLTSYEKNIKSQGKPSALYG